MSDKIETVKPVVEQISLTDLPTTVPKLRQWLVDVATRQDVYQGGKMTPLSDRTTVVVLREGLKRLVKMEAAREQERHSYLVNRFGTVLVPLDGAQPAEGDVIIAEKDGAREQCVIESGTAWIWHDGFKGKKFCAVVKIERWRPCDLPVKPSNPSTIKGSVEEALEKGRSMAGAGQGLRVKPGAGPATSEIKHLKKA